ncbi:MAG TPA: sugar phosphate isomerase/epimerase [Opitutaceae bacterium]|nr:sugar phosphate isomerase/epimerase [Opitutaceae bacterium]
MENTFWSDPSIGWEQRCDMVAAAGFGGIYAVPLPITEAELSRVATLGAAPRRSGIRLAGAYACVDLAHDALSDEDRLVTRLFETIVDVPRIEVSFKCTDAALNPKNPDDAITGRLEPLLAIASRRGIDVGLYHHSFYTMETPTGADRIVRRLSDPRLGLVFCTSHAYALWSADQVLEQLRTFAPRLMSFNVCGCRRDNPRPPAECRNLPLDEGDMHLGPIFGTLRDADYDGDIIIQGYGWKGDLAEMLKRSVAVARRLSLTPAI